MMGYPALRMAVLRHGGYPTGCADIHAVDMMSYAEMVFVLAALQQQALDRARRDSVWLAVISNAPHFMQPSRSPVKPDAFLPRRAGSLSARALSDADAEAFRERRRERFKATVLRLLSDDRSSGGQRLHDYATSRKRKEILLVREAIAAAQAVRFSRADQEALQSVLGAMDERGLHYAG